MTHIARVSLAIFFQASGLLHKSMAKEILGGLFSQLSELRAEIESGTQYLRQRKAELSEIRVKIEASSQALRQLTAYIEERERRLMTLEGNLWKMEERLNLVKMYLFKYVAARNEKTVERVKEEWDLVIEDEIRAHWPANNL